jgi:hypothetical protein
MNFLRQNDRRHQGAGFWALKWCQLQRRELPADHCASPAGLNRQGGWIQRTSGKTKPDIIFTLAAV